MLQRANTEGAKGALSRITLTSDRKATRPNAAGGRDRADPAPRRVDRHQTTPLSSPKRAGVAGFPSGRRPWHSAA
jgi:hypothetical protein